MFDPAAVRYLPEEPSHHAAIEAITDEAFGPGRFVRAAERIREFSRHDPALSFVAALDDAVVGSVRLTPIRVGDVPVLMLGPLAVRPHLKSKGIGKALMRRAAETARVAGWPAIILVGDQAYYWPLGYRQVPRGAIDLPRPADPDRLLILELVPGITPQVRGEVAGFKHELRSDRSSFDKSLHGMQDLAEEGGRCGVASTSTGQVGAQAHANLRRSPSA